MIIGTKYDSFPDNKYLREVGIIKTTIYNQAALGREHLWDMTLSNSRKTKAISTKWQMDLFNNIQNINSGWISC